MRRYRPIVLGVVLALGVGAAAMAEASAPQISQASDAIPPMPLKQALHEFAQREHLQMVYLSRIADGMRTEGARAGLSQRDTLVALLRGTGLQFRYIDPNTVAISKAKTTPDTRTSAPSGAKAKQTTNLQTVVVTGTRAFNRTAVESLAPIDVLSSNDLRSTGAPDLTTALRMLLPSINFAQPSDVDGNEAIQSVQLRGLAPNQVLVLINGKRQHSTSIVNVDRKTYSSGSEGFDFNSIPLNAVDHIEVLRDGAAAQYGSDAIAGVVNIILKGGARHGSVSVTHGQYFAGDGSTWQTSADGGLPLGQKGWVHLSANYEHQEATNRAGPDFRYPGDPTYGTVTFHYGQPKRLRKQVGINLQYSFTPNVQLYGYFLYSKRHPTSNGYFRSLSQYADQPAAVALYPRGYLPVEERAIQDDSETLGLRGTMLGGWHYDVSVNGGGNHVKSHVRNSFNYDLANSPTRFYTGTSAIRDKIVNADFTKSFPVGWLSNPLTVSWGLAYRDQNYVTKAGERNSYVGSGSQGLTGSPPDDAVDKSRQNKAAYIDLEADLTNKLTAEAAVRYEHYSDFGRALPWKLSGRYQFTDSFAMRGTASTGFRAPSLQQMWDTGIGRDAVLDPATNQLVLVRSGTFPASSPVAEALGGQPLQAEKSRNYSLGFVLTPASGLIATLDFYQIAIRNRIIPSESLRGPGVVAYLQSVGIDNVEGASFFNNAADTRTRGADLVVAYPLYLGDGGIMKITGGFNYNDTDITGVKPNPPQLALAGLVLPVFGSSDRANLTIRTPKTKSFLAMSWSGGDWSTSVRLSHHGSWEAGQTDNSAAQKFGGVYVLDASVTYDWNAWNFTLGANNLNDAYPDQNNEGNYYHGNFRYPFTSPIGFAGGYVYGKVVYSW